MDKQSEKLIVPDFFVDIPSDTPPASENSDNKNNNNNNNNNAPASAIIYKSAQSRSTEISVINSWKLAFSATYNKIIPRLYRLITHDTIQLYNKYVSFTTQHGTFIGLIAGVILNRIPETQDFGQVPTLTGSLFFGKFLGPYVVPLSMAYYLFNRNKVL